MKNNLISIIIVNWNGKEVTIKLLESIGEQTYQNYEVIVVDNHSSDGSVKALQYIEEHPASPNLKLIVNNHNEGYVGGNNIGISQAKGDYILVLNNDLTLDSTFLEELIKDKDKADILGVKNYYASSFDTLWSVGSKVNKWTMKASLVGIKEKDKGQYDKGYTPKHIVGSAMFAKREVWDSIGHLNPDYFCYYEETEWQTRAKLAGFSINWCPTARLWHKVAYSSGGGSSPTSQYYLVRNRGKFLSKYAPHKGVAHMSLIVESLLRTALSVCKLRLKGSLAPIKGYFAFLAGETGKRGRKL